MKTTELEIIIIIFLIPYEWLDEEDPSPSASEILNIGVWKLPHTFCFRL